MFVQIVEWLIKFAALINDTKKLSSSRNRKKLGSKLVHLHTLLTRIAKNAEKIHAQLRHMERELKKGDIYYHVDFLYLLKEDQRMMLKELQDLLRDNETLINLYGDNIADEISYVAGLKVSLIDIIIRYSLFTPTDSPWDRFPTWRNWVPKSLDLTDIPIFKQALERYEQISRDRNQHNRTLSDFMYEIDCKVNPSPHTLFSTELGGDKKLDAEMLEYLIQQIDKVDSVNKLRKARDIIAGIIREHFSIDELF
ncbi:MAG: hypothetical protein ACFFCW_25875 [Candidatus Hodarchaeota archaeon]